MFHLNECSLAPNGIQILSLNLVRVEAVSSFVPLALRRPALTIDESDAVLVYGGQLVKVFIFGQTEQRKVVPQTTHAPLSPQNIIVILKTRRLLH
jgi:hypothetical protein